MSLENGARLGLVGCGRVGLEILRHSLNGASEVAAIASRQPMSAYLPLISFDSKYPGQNRHVEAFEDGFDVEGHKVKFLQLDKTGSNLWNWREMGANIVVDTTGRGKKTPVAEFAQVNIDNGANAVIISCPTKDDTPHYVMGVNHSKYHGERIVSNASCTTNATAPLLKIMLDNFGGHIDTVSALTVHALTKSNDQSLDTTNPKPRMGRSSQRNIIPASTGAAKAVLKVLPELDEMGIPISISAIRVPTTDVSELDVNFSLKPGHSIKKEEVLQAILEASQENMKGIVGIAPENAVSSQFTGSGLSVVVLPDEVSVTNDRLVRISAFYDNESGYARRCADLANHMSQNL